jgi:hypothetical protein
VRFSDGQVGFFPPGFAIFASAMIYHQEHVYDAQKFSKRLHIIIARLDASRFSEIHPLLMIAAQNRHCRRPQQGRILFPRISQKKPNSIASAGFCPIYY